MTDSDDNFSEDHVTMMVPIEAGKARVKWMISEFPLWGSIAKSWRIVMNFDQNGELLSCWESGFDKDGNEVNSGGISRAECPMPGGTISCKGFRLSPLQIDALLVGVDHKMARSARGWSCDIHGPAEPARLFGTVTIKSLHTRGLLEANFTDTRVHRGAYSRLKDPIDHSPVQNFDGARHAHSEESLKFQVWTSALGKEVLKELGFLEEEEVQYH